MLRFNEGRVRSLLAFAGSEGVAIYAPYEAF
jgi:hypothetical protein